MDHPGYGDFRARREATVWQRLNSVLRVLLVLALGLVIVSLFVPQSKKLTQSRAEIDLLQGQVTEQKTLLARQTREVNLLKTDPTYLETMARDRLDLMKEGETIFRLDHCLRRSGIRRRPRGICFAPKAGERGSSEAGQVLCHVIYSRMATEIELIDAEALQARVRELRRFL